MEGAPPQQVDIWTGRLSDCSEAWQQPLLEGKNFHTVRLKVYGTCKKKYTRTTIRYPHVFRNLDDYSWDGTIPPNTLLCAAELHCKGGACTSLGLKKYPRCAFKLHIEHTPTLCTFISKGSHGVILNDRAPAPSRGLSGHVCLIILFIVNSVAKERNWYFGDKQNYLRGCHHSWKALPDGDRNHSRRPSKRLSSQ